MLYQPRGRSVILNVIVFSLVGPDGVAPLQDVGVTCATCARNLRVSCISLCTSGLTV